MTTLSLNDRGLDLILGGGLTWIERVPGKASTTILLRGEAGTGKTLSALHIARSLAMALNGDIAWTGVEILPAEVAAQHTSLWPNDTTFSVVHRGTTESSVRRAIHARLLGPLEDAAQLGDALHHNGQPVEAVVDGILGHENLNVLVYMFCEPSEFLTLNTGNCGVVVARVFPKRLNNSF
jgi:DNA polymerase III delta prime subunit